MARGRSRRVCSFSPQRSGSALKDQEGVMFDCAICVAAYMLVVVALVGLAVVAQ
jgi:hypothetical protein